MRPLACVLTVLAVGGSLAGCASAAPEPTSISVSFASVDNGGVGPSWQPGSPAVGVTDEFGSTITVPVSVLNANGTYFRPVVTITTADGSTYTCEEDDPRRHPALVRTTTDFEVPCPAGLPSDSKGAVVVVTDPDEA